ncbi:MAG: ketopantoate reductase family protein [Myxococcota bacterium]
MIHWTIVGAGRIGTFLSGISHHHTLVGRSQNLPQDSGPIVVCTRNDDLDAVLGKTQINRRSDLIFVQNGMLNSWLSKNGLTEVTQALLYFAISKRGDLPVDGGGTIVTGPKAQTFVDFLAKGGIKATAVDALVYQQGMAEKYLWNCIFGLLCQAKGSTVGEVVSHHYNDYEMLCNELGALTERGLGISLKPGWIERLAAYSNSISAYRGAVKEWPWRNGWVWSVAQSPLHRSWLQQANVDIAKSIRQ